MFWAPLDLHDPTSSEANPVYIKKTRKPPNKIHKLSVSLVLEGIRLASPPAYSAASLRHPIAFE